MDDAMLIALWLSKEGFGRPQDILEMPVDIVMHAVNYIAYLAEYQETEFELNREKE